MNHPLIPSLQLVKYLTGASLVAVWYREAWVATDNLPSQPPSSLSDLDGLRYFSCQGKLLAAYKLPAPRSDELLAAQLQALLPLLEEAIETLEESFERAGHLVRNELAAIKSELYLLRRQPDQLENWLSKLDSQADKAVGRTQDLLGSVLSDPAH